MREKLLLLILLIACAAIFFYFLGDSLKAKISIMQSEAHQLQKISAELSSLEKRYGNFAAVVAAAEDRLILAQEYLPDELDDEKFIASLYQIAENKKISINTVNVGEIQSGEIQSQSIRVRLEATYPALLNFIREISDGDRLVRLDNYFVSGGGSEILDCEVEFSIFATKQNVSG